MPGKRHSPGEIVSNPRAAEACRTEGVNGGETICERATNPIRFFRCAPSFRKQSKFR